MKNSYYSVFGQMFIMLMTTFANGISQISESTVGNPFTQFNSIPIAPLVQSLQRAGDAFTVDIVVGDDANPISDLFGLSFKLHFTQINYIDVITPYIINVIPGSFMGQDLIFFPNVDDANGEVSIGMSRKAGQGGVNGSGVVAQVKFESDANTPDNTQVLFSISDITATDANGDPITLNPLTRTIAIMRSLGESISGKIRDYDGQDFLTGVVVKATGDVDLQTTTDDQGNYTLTPIPAGSDVTVTPQNSGMFFQPSMRKYTPLLTSQTDQYFVGSLYGDVSGNDDVMAYDASLVLRHFVGLINWVNDARDPIAADVSGDGNVTPFDASYILRFVANLIQIFPVEESEASRLVVPEDGGTPVVRLESQPLKMGERITFPVMAEHSEAIYSVGLTMFYIDDLLRLVSVTHGEVTEGFLLSHGVDHNRIRIALAGTQASRLDGCLVSLVFDVLSENDLRAGCTPLAIDSIVLNGGSQSVEIENQSFTGLVDPDQFELYQNHPNPFNPITTFAYTIPRLSYVKLEIYNLMGAKIRTLVDGQKQAGHYTVVWDTKDENGLSVSGGMYLYRLQTGAFAEVRKMLLIR